MLQSPKEVPAYTYGWLRESSNRWQATGQWAKVSGLGDAIAGEGRSFSRNWRAGFFSVSKNQ